MTCKREPVPEKSGAGFSFFAALEPRANGLLAFRPGKGLGDFMQATMGRLTRIVAFAAVTAAVSPAAAGSFLDNTLGEVKPEDRIVIANPKPVQLLFEFQSNGAPNAKAQGFL